jgi:hypothetical protein
MILDMIQGCRYLQRSTDRWLLLKNSMTRLKRLESWHGAGLFWNCSIPITNTKGSYLYPCSNTTPSRQRLQHLLPKLMPWRQCPSRTCHQFVPSLYLSHVIMHSRMLPLPALNSPSTERRRAPDCRCFYRMLREEPLAEWYSLLTVKIRQTSHEFTFGVSISFIPYSLVLTPVV